jgi:hypothetical protein
MLKQIIEPLDTLTSIFHHYFFQIFPPSHKHIVLLTCPPCTATHYLSYFTVNQITLIKIRRLCSLVFLVRPSGIT